MIRKYSANYEELNWLKSRYQRLPLEDEGGAKRLRSSQLDLRSTLKLTLCIVLFCYAPVVRGLEPSSQISQYGHTALRLGQNGLDSLPTAITQTTDGYIWIGTVDGLFRYDGVRFTHWDPPAGEPLRNSNIRSLLGARDGSLYIATDFGLARLTRGHLYNYPELLHWTGPLLEDQRGDIWTGDHANRPDSSTLCRVGLSHLSCVGTKDGFSCMYGYSLASETAGSVWIGSKEGICHWRQGEKPENFPMPSLLKTNQYVEAVAVDGQGSLWAGISGTGKGHGLLKFTEGVWKSYITPGIDGSRISTKSLKVDRHGSLWIGTDTEGLYRASEGRLDRFNMASGLSGNLVRQIFEDREGCLWVVTDRGVDSFHDLPLVSFTSREGLSGDTASAITGTQDGDVWIGTDNALNRFHDHHFSYLHEEQSKARITYLFSDSSHQLWSGYGHKLLAYQDNRFVAVTDQDSDEVGPIIEMQEDSRHQLWASVEDRARRRNGLLRIQGLHVVEKAPSPDGQVLNVLAPNSSGGLWVAGGDHGLFWFHSGKFEVVKPGGFDGVITDMRTEPDGGLWLATEQGMILYQNGRAETLSTRNGLPCNAGVGVVNDNAGSHWFYLQCGVVRVRDTELARWEDDPTHHIESTLFGTLDGAQIRAFAERPWLDREGRQWSINGSAVQVVDPAHLPRNALPPPVHVERLVVNHISRPLENGLKLPFSPREIEIDYVGLSYVVPEKVRFRYQLLGYDKDWTDPGTRRQAFYNDLSPGQYTFRVLASNNEGVWNTEGATLNFTVPPAWYQALWFKVLCVLFTAALGYTLYQYRIRQYAAALKMRFDDRVEERTRLARDLHDTLLQTIQGSKMVADNARSRPSDIARMHKALDIVSDWLERATLEGRAALNSLRSSAVDTNDLAEAFRHAAEYCSIGGTIHIEHVVVGQSSDMHPIVRDEIYRIGYEAINNACAHSGGKLVTIEVTYNHNLFLRVRDDGTGIDAKTLQSGREGHYGLAGMRERAEHIGAKLKMHTSQRGTEVTLLVPGPAVFKTYRSHSSSIFSKIFSFRQGSSNNSESA